MELAQAPQLHDLFLAHAGADAAAAEALFDLLTPDVRAWLSTRCLLPGDEWPKEIARAQRAALATVILVSRNAEHAFYLTDEIHTAIALHRSFPQEHRAVAVLLDGRPADPMQVPHGLRSLHSLDAIAEGGLDGVARKLKALVTTLRERASRPAAPLPPAPASAGEEAIARFSATPAREAAGKPPSRPAVRAIVTKVLRSDSDLDAFCGDYFPEVYSRFTGGMDRVRKVNELLDHADLARIVETLQAAYPEAAQPQPTLPERGVENVKRPSPSYPDETTRLLGMQIEAKRASKQRLVQLGADTTEIDSEIVQLRRQLREGGLRAGDALSDGRYLLIQRLGKGGFATVWEAYDNDRQQRVAVKVLHSELAGDTVRRERFFRGARIMAELGDEAVVRVLEPHAEEGRYHYFVMELLAGGDLRRAVLGRHMAGDAILPAILPVGEALARAHKKGWMHRDIKPANILLDGSGALRLTDFDLVGGGDTTGGTGTGAIGTVIYAAPELMHRPQDADARADVYGLGMTIAFGLHGAELTMDVLRDAAGLIQGLPCGDRVKAVLKRAVEWKAEDRFANASDFCDALRKALQPAVQSTPQERGRHFDAIERAATVGHIVQRLTGNAPAGMGMRFVRVPPGRFLMGSSKQLGAAGFDPEADDNELPAHEVEMPHGVWMGEHAVTNAQYGAFLAATKHGEPKLWQDPKFNAAEQPVVGVSFEDALAFCAWLTERAGLQEGDCFDLPTEAEWEHAARGSDGRKYPWGNDTPTPERAWFGQRTGAPAPVGGRPAGKSPFGCQDMAGNVWEWCLDAWERGYGHMVTKSAHMMTDSVHMMTNSVNPCHPGGRGALRVVRGGSWSIEPGLLRCAFRFRFHPRYRSGLLGFRVVCRGFRQRWLVGS